jgi:RES domain-containing protein
MPKRIERFRRVFATLGHSARGSFVRGVPLKHADSPLSGVGSIDKGGRYNAKGAFEVLYFANHADTMLRETRIVRNDSDGNPITVPTRPYVLISLHYEFSHAIDLNDSHVQAQLGITTADLHCLWEVAVLNGVTPITQELGSAARAAGIEAIVVPSAQHPGYSNIDVIKDQLLDTSFVRIHDPEGFPPGTPIEIRGSRKKRQA